MTEDKKDCPQCATPGIPSDSKICSNCGFNFITGKSAGSDEDVPGTGSGTGRSSGPGRAGAQDAGLAAPLPAGASVDAAGSPGQLGADKPASVGEAAPRRRADRVFDLSNVAFSVAVPETAPAPAPSLVAAPDAQPASGGDAAQSTVPMVSSLEPPAAVAPKPAPVVDRAIVPGSVSPLAPLGIELSAVSIPEEVSRVVHPATPHVVLVVDREPRQKRPYGLQPPPAREPIVYPLTRGGHVLGRKAEQDLLIDFDPYASKLHGAFKRLQNGGYAYVDQSSGDKGTRINGIYAIRFDSVPLENGDVLTLGAWTKLIYYSGLQASEAASTEAATASPPEPPQPTPD